MSLFSCFAMDFIRNEIEMVGDVEEALAFWSMKRRGERLCERTVIHEAELLD